MNTHFQLPEASKKEPIMHQKEFLAVVIIVFGILVFLAVPASAINQITVNPPVINEGEPVTITLTTGLAANGTLTVTDPNGTSWSTPINITSAGGGTQTWTFPDNFTGANTTIAGSYNITATATMNVTGTQIWDSEFAVAFLVIPEFSSIILVLFAIATIAVLGFKKFEHATNRQVTKNTVKSAQN